MASRIVMQARRRTEFEWRRLRERARPVLRAAAGQWAHIVLHAKRMPEMVGAIASVVMLVVLSGALWVYSSIQSDLADRARAVAAGETAEQLAAQAEAAPAPAEESEPEPSAPAPAEVVPQGLPQMGEAFIERFRGADLDERWYVSDGWSNGDWMENDWRESQVSLTPVGLQIKASASPEGSDKPLSSGEIRTSEFRYGYFEVRMRVPKAPGLVVGVFTYAGREGGVRPNEIDIEILGRNTRRVELTYHENGRATSKMVDLPFDAADGLHTYAFEWRPESVRWYADDVMIHEATGGGVTNLVRPQEYFIDLWTSRKLEAWVGVLDPSRAPWTLDVSCVAYAPKYDGQQLCD